MNATPDLDVMRDFVQWQKQTWFASMTPHERTAALEMMLTCFARLALELGQKPADVAALLRQIADTIESG